MRESIPYLDQYFGVWAIAVERVRPLLSRWEHIQKIGIEAHLQSPEAVAARETGAQVKAADRESFTRISGRRELAQITLNGTLMKQASSFDESTSTLRARRQIRDAKMADDVAGVLLRIDSPGGTFAGTDDLATDVAALAAEKPVFAFIEDLGASAAYYIAAQATQVFSNRTAGVGSIGTFTVIHDLSALAENEGVKIHVVRAGEFKGMGTPGTEVTEEQLEYLQSIVNTANGFFLNAVANGRGLSLKAVEALADGRVHVGSEAEKLKLTDGVRTVDDVVSELSAAATPGRKRGSRMTTESPTPVETKSETPRAATIQELKAALPKAEAVFLVDQLEKGATLEQAKDAHAANLAAQLEMRDAEIEELKSKQATEPKPETPSAETPKPGVKPIGGPDQSGDDNRPAFDNPKAEFGALVNQKMKETGQSRQRAWATVARENPELREAMIEEANAR